jgi:hypothetical protein
MVYLISRPPSAARKATDPGTGDTTVIAIELSVNNVPINNMTLMTGVVASVFDSLAIAKVMQSNALKYSSLHLYNRLTCLDYAYMEMLNV